MFRAPLAPRVCRSAAWYFKSSGELILEISPQIQSGRRRGGQEPPERTSETPGSMTRMWSREGQSGITRLRKDWVDEHEVGRARVGRGNRPGPAWQESGSAAQPGWPRLDYTSSGGAPGPYGGPPGGRTGSGPTAIADPTPAGN